MDVDTMEESGLSGALGSDLCFLCLSNLSGSRVTATAATSNTRKISKRGRKRKKPDVHTDHANVGGLSSMCRRKGYETLIKYFLHYCGKRGEEQDRLVRKLVAAILMEDPSNDNSTSNKSEESGPLELKNNHPWKEPISPVCINCESMVSNFMNLHMELEVVQMKMVEKIRTIKEIIVRSSMYGGNEDAKQQIGSLEVMIKEHESKGLEEDNVSLVKKRAWLDAVLELQTTVFEKFQEMIDVPCVILKRCVPLPVVDEATRFVTISVPHARDNTEIKQEVDEEKSMNSISPPQMVSPLGPEFPELEEHLPMYEDVHNMTTSIELEDVDQKPMRRGRPKRVVKKPEFFENNYFKNTKRGNSGKVSNLPTPSIKSDSSDDITQLPIVPVAQRKKRAKPGNNKAKKRKRLRGDQMLPAQRLGKNFKKLPSHCVKKLTDTTSRYYECTACKFTCHQMPRFIQHLRNHETPEKLYACPEEDCEEKFFSGKQYYDIHVVQHNDENYFWLCRACQKMISPPLFKKHIERHNLEEYFPCEYCYYCSESVTDAVNHSALHRFTTKKCLFCPEIFTTIVPWSKHMHEMHGRTELALKCNFDKCDYTCFTKSQFNHHKAKHIKPIVEVCVCSYCQQKFKNKLTLKKHIQTKHLKAKTFRCKIEGCTEAFVHTTERQRHRIEVHGLPTFKCDNCGEEYFNSMALHAHKVRNHWEGTPIPCETCGKMFPNAWRLKVHKETHGSRKHVCEQCGYAATNLKRLKAHLEIHKERRFSCDHCGQRFHAKAALNDHIRTHTGERPFACQYCPSAFNQRSALNTHVKRHEKNMETAGSHSSN